MERAGVIIGENLLGEFSSNFKVAYTEGGAGTYTADTYNGVWTKVVGSAVVTALALDTLVTAPVKDAAPNTTAIDATQYSGTIAWFESDGTASVSGNFAASTVYVAKVTLTAKSGYTLTGVAQDSFTYTGAAITNAADSGEVTITFAATVAPEQVATPVVSVSKDSADNREAGVTLSVEAVGGVTFYYTLDGSTPTSGSTQYTNIVTLTAPNQDEAATITIKVIGIKAGLTDSEVATKTVTYAAKPAKNAPTVKAGQGTQTGNATPAAASGNPAAVAYTADMSGWFEDADSDALTYEVVSAADGDSTDVSSDVSIVGNNITYTPAAAQASKTVTIVVKANDGIADSTGNVTITVTVGAVPADVDTTAPVLSAASASAITDTTATLNFTSDEAGTYYYLVYAAADAAPDKATVKAQGDAVAKGTGAASAAANTIDVTSLTASTTYKAYVVVEDAANNISDVATIEITTAASATSATIDPTTGSFDKKAEAQADVTTTITWNSATSVTAIKKDGTALDANTDYVVDGTTLTIKKILGSARCWGVSFKHRV